MSEQRSTYASLERRPLDVSGGREERRTGIILDHDLSSKLARFTLLEAHRLLAMRGATEPTLTGDYHNRELFSPCVFPTFIFCSDL